jgi:CysZ protein
MTALISSVFLAMRSVFAPGMVRVFILSMLLTLVVLVIFVAGAGVVFTALASLVQDHSLAAFMPWLGTLGAGVLSWFLFPGIMPLIINFFDEDIANIIEKRDYPHTPALQPNPFCPELLSNVRFSLMLVTVNILVLPLYLLPGLNLILFYWLNGYFLGREFFGMASRRHLPRAQSEALRKRHSRSITLGGIALTVLATIPVVNLLAPFWGVAVMVHYYHRIALAHAAEPKKHEILL